MLVLATGCQTTNIPNVKFYAEIPFVDCPEGVYVESVTKKRGVIGCEEWKKKRPLMLMIDPDGKKEIFAQWAEACRWAGYNDQQCNVKLKSTRDTVLGLDKLAGAVMGGL
jgi:hypothetical protein